MFLLLSTAFLLLLKAGVVRHFFPTFVDGLIDVTDFLFSYTSSLLEAAEKGRADDMKRIIAFGVFFNLGVNRTTLGFNNTALHLAALGNHVDAITLLITKGADVNALNVDNNTPLHYATGMGHVAAMELLIIGGANIDVINRLNDTPLNNTISFHRCHVAAMKLLLAKGAEVNEGTPLHHAAGNGCVTAIELLIAIGADVNAKDKNNDTALCRASRGGHITAIQLLKAEGVAE